MAASPPALRSDPFNVLLAKEHAAWDPSLVRRDQETGVCAGRISRTTANGRPGATLQLAGLHYASPRPAAPAQIQREADRLLQR